MAKVYLEDSELTNIGNAIRAKAGTSSLLLPSEMPAAIEGIKGGGLTYDTFIDGYKMQYQSLGSSGSANYITPPDDFTVNSTILLWSCQALKADSTTVNVGMVGGLLSSRGVTGASLTQNVQMRMGNIITDSKYSFTGLSAGYGFGVTSLSSDPSFIGVLPRNYEFFQRNGLDWDNSNRRLYLIRCDLLDPNSAAASFTDVTIKVGFVMYYIP